MQRYSFLLVSICLSIGVANQPAHALDKTEGTMLGLGLAQLPKFEGADDLEVLPYPYLARFWGNGKSLILDGATFKYDLMSDTQHWALAAGPSMNFRFGRNKEGGLERVDDALEVGAFIRIDRLGVFSSDDSLGFEVGYLFDVSDTHDGTETDVSIMYRTVLIDSLFIEVRTGLTYGDDNYMQSYFTVTPDAATQSGLTQFAADSGSKSYRTSVDTYYGLSTNWGVIGSVFYVELNGDAEDSPIVVERGDASAIGAAFALTRVF